MPSLAHKRPVEFGPAAAFVRIVWHSDDIYLDMSETIGGERLDFGSVQRPRGNGEGGASSLWTAAVTRRIPPRVTQC
jgi:hypothetical protein